MQSLPPRILPEKWPQLSHSRGGAKPGKWQPEEDTDASILGLFGFMLPAPISIDRASGSQESWTDSPNSTWPVILLDKMVTNLSNRAFPGPSFQPGMSGFVCASSSPWVPPQSSAVLTDVLVLKHKSRILGQWSNPVSGSRKSQASSPRAKHHRV